MSGKLRHSLSEMVFKLTKKLIDTEHKDEMRKIIISRDDDLILSHKQEIMDYCASDIEHLGVCFRRMVGHYLKLGLNKNTLLSEMLLRGDTMARTAIMEREGYPIDYRATKNFSNSVDDILTTIQRDINEQFPDMAVFLKNPMKFVRKEKQIREWIDTLGVDWMQTPTGNHSLSLEAFSKHFNFNHSYPRDNFGAQMLRYLKTKQSVGSFSFTLGRKNFWDYVGTDKRVRAYLNPYASQSARYQPGATGFLFLKAAWLRALCVPPKGKMIVGIDYKSEEFLLSACVSKDKRMVKSYATGDVYLQFGKDSGVLPKDATKESHPVGRQACKTTVLGISYAMTKVGLAKQLNCDEEEAQDLIDSFEDTYEDFTEYRHQIMDEYEDRGFIQLPDGWVMFGDNPNERSIGNIPIQGFGSCILRKAIQLCQDASIKVVAPLHDALYVEMGVNDWDRVKLFDSLMKEAFIYYFHGEQRKMSSNIMTDIEAWSPELEEGPLEYKGLSISRDKYHIDSRSKEEYEQFSPYFTTPSWELL